MNNVEQDQAYSMKTFTTLGGCASITMVVTYVLSAVFSLRLDLVGIVVAMVVSIVGVLFQNLKNPKYYIVAVFNGFLIYLTAIGISSFTPYVNPNTADTDNPPVIKPWVQDANLVTQNKTLNRDIEFKNVTIGVLEKSIETIEKEFNDAVKSLAPSSLSTVSSEFSSIGKELNSSKLSLQKLKKKPPIT